MSDNAGTLPELLTLVNDAAWFGRRVQAHGQHWQIVRRLPRATYCLVVEEDPETQEVTLPATVQLVLVPPGELEAALKRR